MIKHFFSLLRLFRFACWKLWTLVQSWLLILSIYWWYYILFCVHHPFGTISTIYIVNFVVFCLRLSILNWFQCWCARKKKKHQTNRFSSENQTQLKKMINTRLQEWESMLIWVFLKSAIGLQSNELIIQINSIQTIYRVHGNICLTWTRFFLESSSMPL